MTKRFGWGLFEVSVPDEWELAVQGGRKDRGVFRLDDSIKPRLEVSWTSISKKKSVNIDSFVKKYEEKFKKKVEEIAKKGLKRLPKALVKKKVKVCGHDGRVLIARVNGEKSATVLWVCEESGRLYVVNVLLEPGEDELLDAIVQSIKCHFGEDEPALWSLLAVSVRLPANMYLRGASFTTSLSVALFEREKEPLYLLVAYSPMANLLLKKFKNSVEKYLEEAIVKNVLKKIFGIKKVSIKEKSENSVFFGYSKPSLLKSRAKCASGITCFVSEENRIYTVLVYYEARLREKAETLLSNVASQLGLPSLKA